MNIAYTHVTVTDFDDKRIDAVVISKAADRGTPCAVFDVALVGGNFDYNCRFTDEELATLLEVSRGTLRSDRVGRPAPGIIEEHAE